MIKVFYDVETTGNDPKKHSLHQIAGIIEIDDQVMEKFNIFSRPHPLAKLDPVALEVSRVTEKQILGYPDMKDAKNDFCRLLAKYIDRFDRKNKAYLVGWNNRGFDDKFLRVWFDLCGDKYFGSWFWPDTRDVLVLASEYLEPYRPTMPNFQLHTVAEAMGLAVDANRLHDASYDVLLTRAIYRILTGREESI